jgi:hypothetical protein
MADGHRLVLLLLTNEEEQGIVNVEIRFLRKMITGKSVKLRSGPSKINIRCSIFNIQLLTLSDNPNPFNSVSPQTH